MKKRSSRVISLVGTFLFLLGLLGTALAHSHGHGHGHGHDHAPEFDPSLIRSGLALMAGSALLLVERFRRRK
jgi:hypothetical protein